MRTREVTYKNETGLIVYITEEEKKLPEIIHNIDDYKRLYKNVSIFVSGNRDIKSVLKQLIIGRCNSDRVLNGR